MARERRHAVPITKLSRATSTTAAVMACKQTTTAPFADDEGKARALRRVVRGSDDDLVLTRLQRCLTADDHVVVVDDVKCA
jgi:hypothetical protein